MLSRFISRSTHRHLSLLSVSSSSHFRTPTPPSPPSPLYPQSSSNIPPSFFSVRFFCSGGRNGDDSRYNRQSTPDSWKLTSDNDDVGVFGSYDSDLKGVPNEAEIGDLSWTEEQGGSVKRDVFQESGGGGGEDPWAAAVGVQGETEFKPWSLGVDDKDVDVFGIRDEEIETATQVAGGLRAEEEEEEEKKKKAEDLAALQKEEEALTVVLKGPNRAFGDLVAASGISDAMLDSLMALKNFDEIDGLPPLTAIEDMRYEKSLKKPTRGAEMERLKQEDIANSRVRTVDEKGRAYGTGRRKCSIARVWVEPGNGKFVVNDKEFDVYFPMLDHRAALLRPFSETKTLGLWDVKCTVKGGGVSGQVGAIRLGVSRALQNWEPGLRPPLREAGFLTRDSRVVERKKPGKAKARKSFQWVKR